MAVNSWSDWMVTNRRRESGFARAAARSPVSTFSALDWATAARISSGGMPSASQVRASAHSAGKCLFKAREFFGRSDGTDGGQQDRREAEGEQYIVLELAQQAGRSLLARGGLHDLFRLGDVDDLQGSGDGVDLEDPLSGPGHRLVVVVYPGQDVHVAVVRTEYDGTVLLVDAHRPHLIVPDIVDFLVVDAGRLRIGLELLRELPDLLLLRTGDAGVGIKEVAAEGHGWHGQSFKASRSFCCSPSVEKTFHPWATNSASASACSGKSSATCFEGQASSASAHTRPCSS